jgi:hypothetical protein
MSGVSGEYATYLSQFVMDVAQFICDYEQSMQLCRGEVLQVPWGAWLGSF